MVSSEGGIFPGLEGAQLWLRNSEAAFASWGAVFTWLGALGRFFILRGRMVVIAELKGDICILGRFRFRVFGWEAQRAAFFLV